jgi:hypothetical protein
VLQECNSSAVSGKSMFCRMPLLYIPDDFKSHLANNTGTINGTSGSVIASYIGQNETDLNIANVDNSSSYVASYLGPNGKDRLYIILSINFDGYAKYSNINNELPGFTMQFSLPPDITCESSGIMEFNQGSKDIISIQVNWLFQIALLTAFGLNGKCMYQLFVLHLTDIKE